MNSDAFEQQPQVRWLGSLLEEAGLKCWLDYGTLLGYVRNGAILKKNGDFEDLDLAIHAEDEEAFRRLEPAFRAKGYRFYRMNLFGGSFMYKIFPEEIGENSLAIDVGVYRRRGDESAMILPKMVPLKAGAIGRWVHRLKAKPYTWALRLSQGGFKYAIPPRMPEPGSLFGGLYSYKIVRVPHSFIAPLKKTSFGFYVPAESEEFLAHRYGDWRVPKAKWDFWTDQLDIHELTTDELRRELSDAGETSEPKRLDERGQQ
jgi:hypothetical protein